MAQTLTPQLLEQSPDAVIIFVTNPVDLVTYAGARSVDVARGRVFGSGTVLDSSRFRYLIGRRANVAVGNVHGFIVGEHGDSEIPLWSSVSIGGVPAAEWRSGGTLVFDEATRAGIAEGVVNAAYEIIEGKGATNLAIGLSTARIIEAVLGDQKRVLPISSVQNGSTNSPTSRCHCPPWFRVPAPARCCRCPGGQGTAGPAGSANIRCGRPATPLGRPRR